jgi:phage-related protein
MADGVIRIDTTLNTKDFDSGMRKISASAKDGMNKILLAAVKVGVGIRGVFDKIGASIKAVLLGVLLAVGLNIRKVFQFVREAIQDAIALSPDISKKWEEIKNKFVELKHAVGIAFLPLVEFAIPYLQKVLDWLIEIFNKAAMITAALFGQKQALQIVAGSAAKLAKETEKTKKAAQGALAAFDQINVLQQQTAGETATAPKVETQMLPITPDAQKAANEVLGALKNIVKWVIDVRQGFTELWARLGEFWEDIKGGAQNALKTIVEAWRGAGERLSEVWESIKIGAQVAWLVISNVWGIAAAWFVSLWESVKTSAANALTSIRVTWATAKAWFVETVLNPIRSAFSLVLDWIGDKWRSVFSGIRDFVKGTINTIIDYINRMIQSLVGGINAAIGAVNAVASGITGMSVLTPISAPSIPRLAAGAVIPPNAQFAAVLGDQRSGKNLEAPEGLFRQIVREEMANMPDQRVSINFTGTGADIVRLLRPEIRREDIRHGKSLIAGGGLND